MNKNHNILSPRPQRKTHFVGFEFSKALKERGKVAVFRYGKDQCTLTHLIVNNPPARVIGIGTDPSREKDVHKTTQ